MPLELRRDHLIEMKPNPLKTVNTRLPEEDIEYLRTLYEKYKIPYSNAFGKALSHFKMSIWKGYKKWMKKVERQIPVGLKGNSVMSMEEVLQEQDYGYKYQFEKVTPQKDWKRLCLRFPESDLLFLRRISNRKTTLSEYMHFLIKEMKKGEIDYWVSNKPILNPIDSIMSYKAKLKVTVGIRLEDYEKMNEIIKLYRYKKQAKVTKSEIVELAYRLFSKMPGMKQKKVKEDDKREGKKSGALKKISVSLSYRPQYDRRILRSALHYLLKEERLEDNMDKSTTYLPVHPK